MTEKKPIGAPRGNQNARKHGFYSRVLDEAQKLQLDEAREVEGIDEAICPLQQDCFVATLLAMTFLRRFFAMAL